MIWGEVVNEIRRFHLALAQQAPAILRPHSPDFTLDPQSIVFPDALDDMDDWDHEPIPLKLAEWVEFHPVERALLEGPILPIQHVRFTNEAHFGEFAEAVVQLEKNWIARATRQGEVPADWEKELKSRLLRLQTRAGVRRLRQA